MSENEKHYYLDMLCFSKVIFFSFCSILALCLTMLVLSALSEIGVISFAAGLDSTAYVALLIGLIGYSIFSICFAKRKIRQFKALNLT